MVYEIIDSNEEDEACLESSLNEHPQSAGTLDYIGQQLNQVNIHHTDATISSTTSMNSPILTPSIVNVVIEPERTKIDKPVK